MSANNWTICPQCEENRIADAYARRQELQDKYGHIPYDDWKQLETQVENEERATPRDSKTLREDYEFNLESYSLHIQYSCRCSVCDLAYDHNEEIWIA